jgi:glycosyltransferase involved in cell wall biosynthesis
LAQIVRDGWNGIIVPARDADAICAALRRLSGDEALLQGMQANGRALVEGEHSLATMNAVFGTIYRQTAGSMKREARRG